MSWYVVHTHPNAETKARFHLERQGFETYLPLYLKRRRHARRVEMVQAPYFPRYVFVAINVLSQRWRSINSTVGVSRLVAQGDKPLAVVDRVVRELKSRQDEAGFLTQQSLLDKLKSGDRVRVRQGTFGELIGEFERLTDTERVELLLDMLGRKVRVVLDAEMIEPA